MTDKEVLKYLQNWRTALNETGSGSDADNALAFAIEASKKQIPYKPIKNNNELYPLACPNCGCGFMDDVDYDCCPCCGQRLN